MIAFYAVLGFVASLAHNVSVRGTARLWVEGRRWQALSLEAVRLAFAVSLVVVVGHAGVWPLLLAALGFVLASAMVGVWRRRHAE